MLSKNFNSVMTGLQADYRNRTVQWKGEDNKDNFDKNWKHFSQRMNYHNWTEISVEYQFNSIGFRSPEIPEHNPYFVAFGCSYTAGDSLPFDRIYTSILGKQLDLDPVTFGNSGGSNCSSTRLAFTWLPELKPKFVIYQSTFDQRFEWIGPGRGFTEASVYGVVAEGGGTPPRLNNNALYEDWIMCEQNRELAKIKNLASVRWLCAELDLPLYEIDVEDFVPDHPDDYARDLLHPGPGAHQRVAEKLIEKINE